jgi:nucleotide sugar dehydrogenase
VVERTTRGDTDISGEPSLAEWLREAVDSGRLTATCDTATAVSESDVVVMVPPVLLDSDHRPDFANLDAAVNDVGRGLRKGTLVILETTVPAGVTRTRVGPLLERLSGLRAGEEFHLAYSPERVSSGSIFSDLGRYPKLVGGVTPASGAAAAAFYQKALDAEVLLLRDAETAEFTKLAEAAYRDVNIALANELAKAAASAGIDFAEAVKAANTQPYSHIHQAGVGVGGHCIPVYPYFLESAPSSASLTRVARSVNDGMAAYATSLLEAALGSLRGKPVVILGLAYRENVPEARYSSALLLNESLSDKGAIVQVYDPLFTDSQIAACGVEPARGFPNEPCEAVIVQAYHDSFRNLDFSAIPGCRAVLDGRGVLDPEVIESRGLRYIGIGHPSRDGEAASNS